MKKEEIEKGATTETRRFTEAHGGSHGNGNGNGN